MQIHAMDDWRLHISPEPGEPGTPHVRGSGVEVESVLMLLRDGWAIDRVLARFPGLSESDVRACVDYALELFEREKRRVEIRRRIREGDEHPERGIPHESVAKELVEGFPEDDE